MIEFHYETDFELTQEHRYCDWLSRMVSSENAFVQELTYVFCDDSFLLSLNEKYLKHDEYTDIVTFDYSEGKNIGGDIFISVERVRENAVSFNVPFKEELKRVMAHGVLHLLGYGDKTAEERGIMRDKENEKIQLFHVEQ